MEIDKNQVDSYMVDPLAIIDQVHKEEQVTEVMNIPNFPYECFLDQEGSCSTTTSSSTLQRTIKKKHKRMRKGFDPSDVWSNLTFR